MRTEWGRIVLILFGAVAMLKPLGAQAQLGVVSGAPAGFESLDAPRQTMVTVFMAAMCWGPFRRMRALVSFALTTLPRC